MALPSLTRLTLRTELCCENSLSQSVSGFGLPPKHFFFSPNLSAVINAENAAYTAPAFGQKMVRTLESLLEKIWGSYSEVCVDLTAVVLRDLIPFFFFFFSPFSPLAFQKAVENQPKKNGKSTINLFDGVEDFGKFAKDEILRQKETVHLSISTRDTERPTVSFSWSFPFELSFNLSNNVDLEANQGSHKCSRQDHLC